jgi:hypothetical protein
MIALFRFVYSCSVAVLSVVSVWFGNYVFTEYLNIPSSITYLDLFVVTIVGLFSTLDFYISFETTYVRNLKKKFYADLYSYDNKDWYDW